MCVFLLLLTCLRFYTVFELFTVLSAFYVNDKHTRYLENCKDVERRYRK